MRGNIVFLLSGTAHPDGGSTLLRGRQLSGLAAQVFEPRGIRVLCTTDQSVRDSVVILNKNLMLTIAEQDVIALRSRGNYVIADPLDGAFSNECLERTNAIIASSYEQHIFLRSVHVHKPVYFIGHHVDLRIGRVAVPSDRARIAYFGELYNARYREELAGRVCFHLTDTAAASNTSWMTHLHSFNCHYAVRSPQRFDGFKPFTKGFIAAHCGAPILVSSDDREAAHLLPRGYPFCFDISTPQEALDAVDIMAGDFGGPRWRSAVEALAPLRRVSAQKTVMQQLEAALSPALAS